MSSHLIKISSHPMRHTSTSLGPRAKHFNHDKQRRRLTAYDDGSNLTRRWLAFEKSSLAQSSNSIHPSRGGRDRGHYPNPSL